MTTLRRLRVPAAYLIVRQRRASRVRKEVLVLATEGFAVMQLLAFCASAMCVGILLLAGFLVTAQKLFSESVFGAPQEPDEEAGRAYMDEDHDGIHSGRASTGAVRSRQERTALQL
jgi:hypothetical protein